MTNEKSICVVFSPLASSLANGGPRGALGWGEGEAAKGSRGANLNPSPGKRWGPWVRRLGKAGDVRPSIRPGRGSVSLHLSSKLYCRVL